jgi:hypothetical protein
MPENREFVKLRNRLKQIMRRDPASETSTLLKAWGQNWVNFMIQSGVVDGVVSSQTTASSVSQAPSRYVTLRLVAGSTMLYILDRSSVILLSSTEFAPRFSQLQTPRGV